MSDEKVCQYGKPYSEYVKGTKFESGFSEWITQKCFLGDAAERYGSTIICCHEKAPAVMFIGEPDNWQCAKAIEAGLCPIERGD